MTPMPNNDSVWEGETSLSFGTTTASLERLPLELQRHIFSYLDKIDAACLGLAHPTTYLVFLSIHGFKMPLNQRRSAPNSLERAWAVMGKQECRHCGVDRCELYKHIQQWMQVGGPLKRELEFCKLAVNFGCAGGSDAPTCFRVKPSKPRRCGKHLVRTTSLREDEKN